MEPVRFGPYLLLRQIATGGMAEIWVARRPPDARIVVIKRLLSNLRGDEEFLAMFRDEARLTARLEHPNVVQVFDHGEADGLHYIAMEYLGGLALSALMKKARSRVGGLRQEHVASLMAQAAAGLHAAHTATSETGAPLALVHRDISPQNLLVQFDGALKVVDFGIAKASEREAHTQAGIIKGKFAYMSPEQCRSQAVDGRSDVFALGIVLWEVLSGRRLFKKDTTYKTFDAVQNSEIPPVIQMVPGVWAELDEVCRRALERDLAARYPTAAAMQADLEAALVAHGGEGARASLAQFMAQNFQPELAQQRQTLEDLAIGRGDGVPSAYGAEIGEEEEVTTYNPERGDGKAAQAGARVGGTFHASVPMPGQMVEEVSGARVRTRAAASGVIVQKAPAPEEPSVTSREPSEATEFVDPVVRRKRLWIIAIAVALALPVALWLVLG